MIKHIKTLFFTVILMFAHPLYADVINSYIERLGSGTVKDINCQNYTITAGALLDISGGGTLREVTTFTNNGTWDYGTGRIIELGAWVNNGTVAVKPTQTGAIPNLEFTTMCGPISVLGTSDTDGDGISDADEGDNAVALGHGITLDQDNDGTYNFLDDDSDGDGLTDVVEGGNSVDTDGDGIPDYLDANDSRPNNNNDSSVGNTIGDDVFIDILINDTLKDGSTPAANDVNVTLIAPAGGTLNADGTVTVAGEGTWKYDSTTGMLTFSPLSGFTGNPASIEYTVTEIATGLTSTPASVNVEYDAAAMNPVANDDTSIGNIIGDDVSIDILNGDTLGNGAQATLSDVNITLIAPAGETLNADGTVTVTGEGTWKYDSTTGMLIFNPLSGFVGNPAPMEYILTEIATGLTDTATVTVGYNVDIKAVKDGTIVINHYGSNIIDVLKNDIFNGTVTIGIVKNPENGTVEVVIGSDGRAVIMYSPFADINHTPDTFKYSITDANGNTSEARVKLDIQCASSQTSDGDAYSNSMLFIMMILTMLIGLYAIRREEVKK